MDDKTNYEDRLFLLLVIGSDFKNTLTQLETLKNSYLPKFKENLCYGNSVLFVSNEQVSTLGNQLNELMGSGFGHVLIDITDNLNPYDFIANITENHSQSEDFVKLVKSFLYNYTKEEEINALTLEEQLDIAVKEEDFNLAIELRDKINSKKEAVK